MLKNLLKYGMVILAMIASTVLLWADHYIEVVHDTVIVPCENETIVVKCADCCEIDSLVQNNIYLHNTIGTKESKDTACWYVKLLKHIKEYKSEYMLLVLLFAFVINIFLSYDKKKKNLIRWILLVAIVAILSDSSWFYLLFAAILLIYVTREDPDLLKKIREAMSALQGRNIPTDLATPKEIEDKRKEEAKETMPSIPTSPVPAPKEKNSSKSKNVGADGKTLAERIEARKNMHLSDIVRKAINAEDLIIQMLSKEYPNIETSRVIEVEGKRMVLDGFVQGEHENLIIEVKYISNPIRIRNIAGLPELLKVRDYVQAQSHKPTFIRIYVVTDNKAIKGQMVEMSTMPYVSRSLTSYADIKIYTFNELNDIISHKSIITNDYKTFMDMVNWDDLTTMEKAALFESAHGKINEKGIPFAVKEGKREGSVWLSHVGSDITLILDEKGCDEFPKWLEDNYMNGEDGYSYLGFLEAMEKND